MTLAGKHAVVTGGGTGVGAATAHAFAKAGAKVTIFGRTESVLAAQNLPHQVCDVTDEASMDAVFETVKKEWGSLDFIVHAVAFSDKEELKGQYLNTTRDNFLRTMDISCYSLTALSQRAAPLMNEGGSIITLTYYGAERVMPHYNVMGVAKASLEANVRYMASSLGPEGIRVNALSAGPIRTLAASGISGMRDFLNHVEKVSPLRRNVTIDEVGNVAAFMCSDYASAVTGEITYVDNGFNSIGMG